MQSDGVADGARTHDNRNHNPGLYQLSYSHHWCKSRAAPAKKKDYSSNLACPEGIEPPTLGLEGRCSIQLSYGQIHKTRSPGRKPCAIGFCAASLPPALHLDELRYARGNRRNIAAQCSFTGHGLTRLPPQEIPRMSKQEKRSQQALFEPVRIGDMELSNRIAMAPL